MKGINALGGPASCLRLLIPALVLLATMLPAHADNHIDLKLERFEDALSLTPNIDNGRKIYQYCVACHGPEGWGTQSGAYPQIAGQLQSVTIKQLGDICSRQRGNPIMEAFTSPRVMESAQDVADIAAYIAQLPMTDQNGKGSIRHGDIESGAALYDKLCENCHGKQGVGDSEDQTPRLQGQHYKYLMRQFSLIRGAHRGNADEKMVRQIQKMSLRDQKDVMSYIASIRPPAKDLAKEGWVNPDFPNHDRRWLPPAPKY